MRTVITYGTFDIFHAGHLNILRRARELGDRLVVGVSTDEFNLLKGKRCVFPYEERAAIVSAVRYVDEVFPESSWEQKRADIIRYSADTFVMGDDWRGMFDDLYDVVQIVYLPRTPSVSTTEVKDALRGLTRQQIEALKSAVDVVSTIVGDLS